MDESINVKNKKQNRRKPPLSFGRIAGEIFAGTATGFAAAVLASDVISLRVDESFEAAAAALAILPPVYGLASTGGVYLVGNIAKQTGSFLLTLIFGLLGGLTTHFMLFGSLLPEVPIAGVGKVVEWAGWALLFLVPPILATCGFNSSRRYKKPPSS